MEAGKPAGREKLSGGVTRVEIYTTEYCGYCRRAKTLLDSKGTRYMKIRVDAQPEQRMEMRQRSGRHSVPQIFIDGHAIGGCSELFQLEHAGRLDELLAREFRQ